MDVWIWIFKPVRSGLLIKMLRNSCTRVFLDKLVKFIKNVKAIRYYFSWRKFRENYIYFISRCYLLSERLLTVRTGTSVVKP